MSRLEEFQQLLLGQLASGGGLNALVRAAGRFLELPVNVCDAALTRMAFYSRQQEDDQEHVFVVQPGKPAIMRPEIVEELHQKGILDRLQQDPRAFTLYNPDLDQWEMFCAISIQKQTAGYLFVRTKQQPDPLLLDCWSALGAALAAEFQKRDLLPPDSTQSTRAVILRQLVQGQLTDEALARKRLAQTGWKLRESYRLYCLFSPERSLFANIPHRQLLHQLTELLPESLCCPMREQILLLCPAQPLPGGMLERWLSFCQFCLAGSMPFSGLCQLPGADSQAQALVQMLLHRSKVHSLQEESPLYLFEEHLPLCAFLNSFPAGQPESWLHPHIRLFLEHDRQFGTDYIGTLRAYFAHNRSTRAASEALFIHKTTLFYRFSQMEKLAGPFLQDPKLLFLYEYSLLLLGTGAEKKE